MGTYDFFRLILLPVATIIGSFVIKFSKNDKFKPYKKFWLLFLVIGLGLLLFRVYDYFLN